MEDAVTSEITGGVVSVPEIATVSPVGAEGCWGLESTLLEAAKSRTRPTHVRRTGARTPSNILILSRVEPRVEPHDELMSRRGSEHLGGQLVGIEPRVPERPDRCSLQR